MNENQQNSCTDYRQDAYNQTSPSNTSKSKSFANATKNEDFPTDEQCIIFPYTDGIRLSEYVYKLAEVIRPSDIRYCSRISRNRVSFYLSSVKIVDEFLDKQSGILINKQFVKARRLINPDKRILISNAPPSVPHELIAELMNSLNVNLSSDISFLKFGIKDDNLSHLHSFRRQVYVTNDTVKNLPTSAVIHHLGQQRRIFFNDDKVRCFHCKEFGHISAACPQAPDNDDIPDDYHMETHQKEDNPNLEPEISQPNHKPTNDRNSTFDDITAEQIQSVIKDVIHQSAPKRPPPSTISNESSSTDIIPNPPEFTSNSQKVITNTKQDDNGQIVRSKNKKPKMSTNNGTETNQPLSIKELLKPIEENFDLHKKEYPVSFSNFSLIMDLVRGHKNPISVISDISTDYSGIHSILKQNYPFLNHRSMKIRFTKLLKRLKEACPDIEKSIEDSAWSDEISDTDAPPPIVVT